MREIEFRGYESDTNRWYYGSYVRLERTTPYPLSHNPEADKKKFEDEQVDHYIFFTESMDWGLETRKLQATVDPKSVGQYTGLRDKNGKKIFEGDIVRRVGGGLLGDPTKALFTGEVIFTNNGYKAKFHYPEPGTAGKVMHEAQGNLFNRSELEVIGNIWESPELLS